MQNLYRLNMLNIMFDCSVKNNNNSNKLNNNIVDVNIISFSTLFLLYGKHNIIIIILFSVCR